MFELRRDYLVYTENNYSIIHSTFIYFSEHIEADTLIYSVAVSTD